MKKIYEDDELILIDTQNLNRAYPIVAFYGEKEIKYDYIDGLKISDLYNELEYKIRHEIYKYCVEKKIYENSLRSYVVFIETLKKDNSDGKFIKKIEMLKNQMNHLKEDLDFAERFYNGK